MLQEIREPLGRLDYLPSQAGYGLKLGQMTAKNRTGNYQQNSRLA